MYVVILYFLRKRLLAKSSTSSQASLQFSATFVMKPRDKEGRKALFGFHLLVRSLAISRKSLAQTMAPIIWISISRVIYFTTEIHTPVKPNKQRRFN